MANTWSCVPKSIFLPERHFPNIFLLWWFDKNSVPGSWWLIVYCPRRDNYRYYRIFEDNFRSRKAGYRQGMFADVNVTFVCGTGERIKGQCISQTELDYQKYETRKSWANYQNKVRQVHITNHRSAPCLSALQLFLSIYCWSGTDWEQMDLYDLKRTSVECHFWNTVSCSALHAHYLQCAHSQHRQTILWASGRGDQVQALMTTLHWPP